MSFLNQLADAIDIQQQLQVRWFYTAVTRAQQKLYFVNFTEEYFF